MHEPDPFGSRFCAHPGVGVAGAKRYHNAGNKTANIERDGGIVRISWKGAGTAPRWCPRFREPADVLRRCEVCGELYDPERISYAPGSGVRIVKPTHSKADVWCRLCAHFLTGLSGPSVVVVEEVQAFFSHGKREDRRVRTRYEIGPEKASRTSMRGFGGRQFRIRFFDDRDGVTTTNLWSAGQVPEHLYEHVPVTGEFVEGEGASHVLR